MQYAISNKVFPKIGLNVWPKGKGEEKKKKRGEGKKKTKGIKGKESSKFEH